MLDPDAATPENARGVRRLINSPRREPSLRSADAVAFTGNDYQPVVKAPCRTETGVAPG